MIIVLTKKWRGILDHYLRDHGLPHAGTLPDEHGWTVNTNRPFGKPGRNVIIRVSNNLEARHLITKLDNNGTLNSKVQEALLPKPPPETVPQRTLRLALKEVGVHEMPIGSNRGARVEYYQSSTGAYGQAWCASFASKMAQNAGYHGKVSAGAWDLTDNCGVRILDLKDARPGDCVSLNEGEGHVGILEAVHVERGVVTLVAGNTSDSVKINDYPIKDIHSICRLV